MAAGFLQVCWAGATVVLTERLDAAQLVEVLVEQRVSTVAGVPSTFRALLELPAERLRAATAGLRLCTSGGAPLPPRHLAEFRSITGLSIVEGYGLTEAGPVVTSNPIDGAPKPGSVGRPLPGIELRLVGPDEPATGSSRTDADPALDLGAGEDDVESRRHRAGGHPRAATCSPATGRTVPVARTPTAGSAPPTSGSWTPTATCTWSTGRRTWSW